MKIENIKQYRNNLGISIETASNIIGMPKRTFIRYENDDDYGSLIKRRYILEKLHEEYDVTETKGILSVDLIKIKLAEVFSKYHDNIDFCYLFGSYAKGYAKDNSDVDLLISTNLKGLDFVGLSGEIKDALKKNIDLLRLDDVSKNQGLLKEIMKDGVKIYEQYKK